MVKPIQQSGRTLLYVENAETLRVGMRGLVRLFPSITLVEARDLDAARAAIVKLRPRAFTFAVLDWSLPDGFADELLPLLKVQTLPPFLRQADADRLRYRSKSELVSTRVVFVTSSAVPVPNAHVIPKDPNWRRALAGVLKQ